MFRVKSVKPGTGYRLHIEFEDGVSGIIDLSSDLYGPMFEPLRDVRLFERAFVDDYGVICWPNGADLAPEVVREEITGALKL
jgi:hypothetical protein